MSAMPPAFPTRSSDTTTDAERVQLDLIRAAPIARRLHLAFSLSASAITLARRAIARAHPSASKEGQDLLFVQQHYGAALAREVRADHERRRRQRHDR